MRAFAVATLGLVGTLGGCLQEGSTTCPGGWTCPAGLACGTAAPYCGDSDQVAACTRQDDWHECSLSDGVAGSCRGGICERCSPDREGCRQSGWTAMASPVDTELDAVWVAGHGDAYAVGAGGTLLHYDGTRWSAVATTPPLPADQDLIAIWGSSPDDFYIVTLSAAPNLLHVTGGTTLVDETSSQIYKALSGTAANDILAAGILVLDRYDGASWNDAGAMVTRTLNGVHATSATRAFAVGGQGTVLELAGDTWTTDPVPMGFEMSSLRDVWAGPTEAVAVGALAGTTQTLLHQDAGNPWAGVSYTDVSTPMNLSAVWGSDRGIYVVGDQGTLLFSLDGATWSSVSAPGKNDLHGIDGAGPTDVFVVGSTGAIWRYWGP